MSVSKANIGRFLTQLLATCLLVLLAMTVFVNTPFFSSDRELITPALTLDPALATTRPLALLNSDEDALLSGYLFAPDNDAQVYMQEHDLDGPCEGAGIRLKAIVCDSCMLLQGPAVSNEVPLIMWVDNGNPEPVITTTTPDCSQIKPNGRVVVSAISMGSGPHVGARGGVEETAKIITGLKLPYSLEERMSLTLGSWVVEEYALSQELPILHDIKSVLLKRGWTLPEGQETSDGQLTFVSSQGKILIVTVVSEDTGLSVITMLNNQEEGAS